MNEIITGNCANVMSTWEPDCIDLTVTSPPYDNLRDYEGYHFDFEAIAAQLWRVTKPGGVVVWVVGDATVNGSETGTSFRQALHFMELGFNLHDTMIYRKKNFIPLTHKRYEQEFEYMFVLSKGTVNTFNPRMVPTNGSGMKQNLSRKGYGFKEGAYRRRNEDVITKSEKQHGNIFSYSCGASGIDHPAPFNELLARDHIVSWSNPGDTVLDPMCGSGTTLKMAVQTGRNYIGIDISEKYCEIARKRVAIAQPPLFVSDMQANALG